MGEGGGGLQADYVLWWFPVSEGESGRFTIRVDGQPLPKVMWSLNDQPITAIEQCFKSTSDWFDFHLEVVKGAVNMTGKVTARVKNEHGEIETHGVLDVEGE